MFKFGKKFRGLSFDSAISSQGTTPHCTNATSDYLDRSTINSLWTDSDRRSSDAEVKSVPTPMASPTTFTNPFNLNTSQTPSLDQIGLTPVTQPLQPIVDIIFIHGLEGSSHRTWSWEGNTSNFWPNWLADEPDLSKVRIHTYGYSARITSPSNKIRIMHLASKLLLNLQTSPQRPPFGSCPIIFVTHSMGGLVAKKAFTMGYTMENYKDIVAQVKAMIFFATPHHGGNGAKHLDRVLQLFSLSKDYIPELSHNSTFLQDLDEDFANMCKDLKLVSFWEANKTKLGTTQCYIVDKESSVLNLPNETRIVAEADHQNACKFADPEDARYHTIRNVLVKLTRPYMNDDEGQQSQTPIEELETLETLLSINGSGIEDELSRLKDLMKEGTCNWIEKKDWFNSWFEDQGDEHHLLWISGEPATGKSVLAAHITTMLRNRYGVGACLYHSFVFSDKSKRSASYLLRSLAFQAGCSMHDFRAELLRTSEPMGIQAAHFEGMSASIVWEKVFRGMLLNFTIKKPMYWVIDGLDESTAVADLFKCLKGLGLDSSIRILLVSRPTNEITLGMKKLQMKYRTHQISQADTIDDISVYIQDAMEKIPLGVVSRRRISDNVLKNASGNFLWVSLIMKELQKNWYRESNIDGTLTGFPREMKPLYTRMIQEIETSAEGHYRHLASKCLMWLTFSFRPLYVSELKTALQLEYSDLTSAEDTISSICGDFVQLRGSTVKLIHETAQQFLDSPDSGDIVPESSKSHKYLTEICFQHISLEGKSRMQDLIHMQNKAGRRSGIGNPEFENVLHSLREGHPFLDYAAKSWAYHLSLADPASEDLLDRTLSFLSEHCLFWINVLALLGDLNSLIQSAQYLKTYIKASDRAMNRSTAKTNDQASQLRSWAVDLIKIVGKFGSNLIRDPKSIYRYMLPFCPANSVIRKAYGQGHGKFQVSGISYLDWDDCHARLSVGSDATASKVVATEKIFAALVPQDHSVVVWHAGTCEQLHQLHHGEYVTQLAVNKKGNLLCTSGAKTLKVWNLSDGTEVGRIQKDGSDRVLGLSFGSTDDKILVGYQDNLIVSHDWRTQKRISAFQAVEDDLHHAQGLRVVSFSPDGSQVAVSSRIRPAELWHLGNKTRTYCLTLKNETSKDKDETFQAAEAIQWHPEMRYLFLIYHNMTLVYWNPVYDEQVEHSNIKANMILCSPCGKFLLTSNYSGTVKIYDMPDYSSSPQPDFHLLYHLECQESILDLVFSPNGQRFYEVHDSICSVWEPDELVPAEDLKEDGPVTLVGNVSTNPAPAFVSTLGHVSAIACAPDDSTYCCGRDDGTLTIHTVGNNQTRKLSGHSNDTTIIALTWSSSGNRIASGDDSGHILIRKVRLATQSNGSITVYRPADLRVKDGINQLLFSPDDKFLLIATSSTEIIWDVDSKKILQSRQCAFQPQVKWISHPTDKTKIISIGAEAVHTFLWSTLECLTTGEGQKFERSPYDTQYLLNLGSTNSTYSSGRNSLNNVNAIASPPESLALRDDSWKVECIAQLKSSKTIIIETVPSSGHTLRCSKRRRVELLKTSDLYSSGNPEPIRLQSPMKNFSHEVSKVLGSYRNEIVFINHQNSLCTLDVDSTLDVDPVEKEYKRHIPLPNDWISPGMLSLNVLNEHGTLFSPRYGQVGVIRNGIGFQ